MNMNFSNPQYLWLLIGLIPLIFWYVYRKTKSQASLNYSSAEILKEFKKPIKQHLRHILFILRLTIFVLIIMAIARPQVQKSVDKVTEGIDIVIALDISGSMLATDFKPNRLEASKEIAIEFINKQEFDRIGLVVFSAESYTQCPVTIEHSVLINMFGGIKQGLIDDGTAIGYGLATAVNNLKDSRSKSKIVILLTDGENNTGTIDPITAAELAATYGIKVYTIGVGKNGYADMPVQTVFGQQMQKVEVKIDEETLKTISAKTEGKYFRAIDNNSLKQIYDEINTLEKDKIREKYQKLNEEKYLLFLIPACIILILEVVLKISVFKTIP
jgi:Ca-activated chloride channel family protein